MASLWILTNSEIHTLATRPCAVWPLPTLLTSSDTLSLQFTVLQPYGPLSRSCKSQHLCTCCSWGTNANVRVLIISFGSKQQMLRMPSTRSCRYWCGLGARRLKPKSVISPKGKGELMIRETNQRSLVPQPHASVSLKFDQAHQTLFCSHLKTGS